MHLPPQSSPREATALQQLRVMYFILLGAVAAYWFAVVEIFDKGLLQTPIRVENVGMIKLILALVAVADGGLLLFFRYWRITSLVGGPASDPERFLARLRADYIVCFMVSESVALYGFLLRLIGGDSGDAIPFFLGSVVLFLLCYPRVPPAPGSPTG